ncbi:MAG: cobalt-precorrin-5B (C(1))-methyltransferase [Myxococcales bacterium]|nr:cobalt-precorrin-5B (C(1))-methyltransferase [Myxococcales bacterium]
MAPAGKKALNDRRGMRTGFTTGACAAAAAKAAARCLLRGESATEIETTLPNGSNVRFALERCEALNGGQLCSVFKDAGDDPDVTHGAELVAHVVLTDAPGVELSGGDGVATVTQPGLGLEVGSAAINPVPRKNIVEMVQQELAGSGRGAVVTISVPGGQEMAKGTLNSRLGLLGGISILGTSGIVRPYSTAAYKASVVQAIDVARSRGHDTLVLTTGGRSEQYAMALHPRLGEECFIQVGDFIGTGLKHCKRRGAGRVVVVGMIGKLSKMAEGVMQTHQAGSSVNLQSLSELAGEAGGARSLVKAVATANTGRHALELCKEAQVDIATPVCARVAAVSETHVGGGLPVHVYMVDFGGELLGGHGPTLG